MGGGRGGGGGGGGGGVGSLPPCMKVRYTETALAELDQIFTYIAKENAQAAAVVVDHVEQLVARIGEFPHLAYATDEAAVRVIPI